MRILILSCNTGEGHNSAARAIKEELDERNVECIIEDTLSFASESVSDTVSKIYVSMISYWPDLWGKIYESGKTISNSKTNLLKSPAYYANTLYADKLYEYIAGGEFDAIIMPHLYPGEALTYIRSKYGLKTRLYMLSTDYAPAPLFEELDVDRYFIPHRDLFANFVNRGIPSSKLTVTGIPVSRRFTEHLDKSEAREKLGLPKDAQIALIMGGSMGFGNIRTIVEDIAESAPEVKQIIMGGNNERLKQELRIALCENENVRILDFTKEVPLYMDAADLLFTKPGGLTSTEACVKNIPILHTDPIPGNETENIRFFETHGLSIPVNPENAARIAVSLLKDEMRRDIMINAQKREIIPDSAKRIADFVINDLNEIRLTGGMI
ncbi:MAG: glycosyl transferase [Clostridia bacterium]|nr:glycosyl transferase [Lachnospiraceae bacterium]MBR0439069.1 glycosyl transferase [Clostridia bacterium]